MEITFPTEVETTKDLGYKPKVLIAVPTYPGHAFCRVSLLKFLDEVAKEPWIDVLVLWNGDGDPWGFEEFEVLKIEDFAVEYNRAFGEQQSLLQTALVKKQNIARKRALDEGYTHLFLLESDVIPPAYAIKKLLSWEKDVASGVYIVKAQEQMATRVEGNQLMKMRLAQSGLDHADCVYYVRESAVPAVWTYQRTSVGGVSAPRLGHRIMMLEDWLDLKISQHHLYPVAATGVGCMLISRRVLEKVRFMGGDEYLGNKEIGMAALSDYIFCENAKEAGFEIFLDVDLICQHHTVTSHSDQKSSKEFSKKFRHEKKEKKVAQQTIDIETAFVIVDQMVAAAQGLGIDREAHVKGQACLQAIRKALSDTQAKVRELEAQKGDPEPEVRVPADAENG